MPVPGDFIWYKLKDNGEEGMCLLTRKDEAEPGCWWGYRTDREGDIHPFCLAEAEILYEVEVLAALCHTCRFVWKVTRPKGVEPLECPRCREMSGRAKSF